MEKTDDGQLQKDYYLLLTIANKNICGFQHWLLSLHNSGYTRNTVHESVLADYEELLQLLGSITKTMKAEFAIPTFELRTK